MHTDVGIVKGTCIRMYDGGDRLREERERLGLNQSKFAALVDVHRNAQSNYEAGTRAPDAAYLALASKAGADVLYILTGRRADSGEAHALQTRLGALLEREAPAFVGPDGAALEPVGKLSRGEELLVRAYRAMTDGDKAVLERTAWALSRP